jgi:small-conductance mechanosensitive channel
MLSTMVTNFYDPETEMSVLIDVGVSYDSNLKHVQQVTIEVAKEVMEAVEGGIAGNEPFIRYNSFGESSINFTVILRAREYVDQYLIKHEFIMRLHERYEQEGIEIPFPIRTLYTRNITRPVHKRKAQQPSASASERTTPDVTQGDDASGQA